jgi:C_GCAxxG_C_C family probable redox protein
MEEMYVQKAHELRNSGYNCAQTVACSFKDLLDIDEKTLKSITTGFGGGMGGNDGTCGAISGAIAVVSLIQNNNNESKEDIYNCVKKLFDKFVEHNGSSICKELKGTETGVELTSCKDCVLDAVRLTYHIIHNQKESTSIPML